MNSITIQEVENGFIVIEGGGDHGRCIGKQWAFETADSLAVFVAGWGGFVEMKKDSEKGSGPQIQGALMDGETPNKRDFKP